MGSRLYEFLADSFLFRDDFFDNTLPVPTNEIQRELDQCRRSWTWIASTPCRKRPSPLGK
jgi:hypothetical protein